MANKTGKVEVKRIEDLIPDPNNINKHTQKGHGLVENSIRRRGVGRGILAAGKNTEKPVIMAGNLTHEKARDAGIDEVIFVHTTGNQLVVTVRDDLDPNSPEAIALGIEDNESGKQSYNPDIDLLATMTAGDNGILSALKNDDKVFGDLLKGMGIKDAEPVDAEPQVNRADELQKQWGTELGQLWILGKHKLLIGDCTVRENVERLMDVERASMCFTSPPYNAGISAKLRGNTSIDDNLYQDEYDDKQTQDDYQKLLDDFTERALLVCEYVFVNLQVLAGNKQAFIKYWHGHLDSFCDVAIWRKRQAQPAAAKRVMDSIFEFIIIFGGNGSRAVGTRDFRGMVRNVFEGDAQHNNENSDIHAATMPMYLPEYFIKTFTNENELIYEPFCGTGTTIIAAHNLSRRCYAMEISPSYGAVILQRFLDATGITPVLVTE